jgi:hypothetical protein
MLLLELYTVVIDYLDGLKTPQQFQFAVKQSNNTQNITVPTINYSNLVNSTVTGTTLLDNITELTPLSLTLTCNSTNATKQPVVATSKSQNGLFNFSFTSLAQFDKPLNCTLTSDAVPQILPATTNFLLSEPTFSRSNITLNLTNAF